MREVLDPVLRGLHVAVQHGAVGRNAELVGDAMHPEPLLAGELPLGDGGPHRGAEHLGPAAGQAGEPRLLACASSTSRSEIFSIRARWAISTAVSALMCTCGMPLLEPADHVGVVAQPELGVQPADDVELAGGHAARLLGLVEHLLQRAGVGALLLRHPGEGAEHAGVPEDADVGRD